MEARFRLNREDEKEITVPFLVTPEQLEQPIIGYNVIELFLQEVKTTQKIYQWHII